MYKCQLRVNNFKIIFIGADDAMIDEVVSQLKTKKTRAAIESLLECLSEDEFLWNYEIKESDL